MYASVTYAKNALNVGAPQSYEITIQPTSGTTGYPTWSTNAINPLPSNGQPTIKFILAADLTGYAHDITWDASTNDGLSFLNCDIGYNGIGYHDGSAFANFLGGADTGNDLPVTNCYTNFDCRGLPL